MIILVTIVGLPEKLETLIAWRKSLINRQKACLSLGFHWSNMPTLTKTTTTPFFFDNSIWSTLTFTFKHCQNGFNKFVISLVVYIMPAWPNEYSG